MSLKNLNYDIKKPSYNYQSKLSWNYVIDFLCHNNDLPKHDCFSYAADGFQMQG